MAHLLCDVKITLTSSRISGNAFLFLVTLRHFWIRQMETKLNDRRRFSLEQIPRLVRGKFWSVYGEQAGGIAHVTRVQEVLG